MVVLPRVPGRVSVSFWQPFAAVFVFLSLVLASLTVAVPATAKDAPEHLVIRSATGTNEFTIELARTPSERATGLMFRRSLPADGGMLFDFQVDGQVSMWMKNTYIPLDMLFIKADGTISSIAANRVPHSLDVIGSKEPVRAVLEVRGGTAAKLGIKAGDMVEHMMFQGQ